ncbi:MAG: LamG domain-containing protein [Symploca sp. SIO1C2]|nr:LamG domain-containing protein [Symploca sp. SIO1C2]
MADKTSNENPGTLHGGTWKQDALDFIQPAPPKEETATEEEPTTTDKEEPTTAEQEQTTTNKEEPTTAEQEQTTTDKEESTTAEQEQTTTNKEEPTTAEQEQTTTDKEEPTTAEQEQTTTDKEEPTTAEQEQTTTDKEESTTAEQEQTTTDKEEPTTAEQEKLPSVLTFDGKDDFIDCGSGINLTNTSFTIEFWAKRQTVGKWHMIVFQGEQQKHQGLHIGFRNSDVFTLAFYGDDLNTGQYTDSDWHHWSCVYNHERQQQIIYCDGELEACRQPANYQGTGNLYIGALKGTSAFFEGQLADLRIWQGVRTPQEIQDAMNSRLTGNESGLLAYWPLDEGKGTTITDKTGNGNDGKITGAVWEKMEIPFEDAASSLNKPIEITVNGEKEYIDIPSYSALNLIDDFYIRFKWGVAKIEKDDIKINMKIRRS